MTEEEKKERARERQRKRYREHKEEILRRARERYHEYYLSNAEKRKEASRRYYLRHREELVEKQKRYREKNRETIRERARKRYAAEVMKKREGGGNMRYYSLHWDGKTHYIAECDEHDLTVCIYRGYHNYKTNEITLYPHKRGMAYGEIGKKKISIRQVMPKSERFKRLR